MDGMTQNECNSLRENVLELAGNALRECDYFYLHGKSFLFAYYYVIEQLSYDLDLLKQKFYELHDKQKRHADKDTKDN